MNKKILFEEYRFSFICMIINNGTYEFHFIRIIKQLPEKTSSSNCHGIKNNRFISKLSKKQTKHNFSNHTLMKKKYFRRSSFIRPQVNLNNISHNTLMWVENKHINFAKRVCVIEWWDAYIIQGISKKVSLFCLL